MTTAQKTPRNDGRPGITLVEVVVVTAILITLIITTFLLFLIHQRTNADTNTRISTRELAGFVYSEQTRAHPEMPTEEEVRASGYSIHPSVHWSMQSTSDQFCIWSWMEHSSYTPEHPFIYDSAGGFRNAETTTCTIPSSPTPEG